MKYNIKQFFKGWNIFEFAFLALAWIVPTVLGIVFYSNPFEIISSVLSLTCAILIAKGKIEGYFVGLISNIFLAIVCFQTKVYGEAIVCLAIYYPILIFGIFSWARNKQSNKEKGRVVTVGDVKIKELCLVILSQLLMGVGYYFILKAFGTEYLVISAVSVSVQVIASYLLARRSQFGCGPYVFGDIIQIVLWTMIVANGSTSSIAVLVMPCMYLVNDIYGFFEWRRLKKSQHE